LAAIEAAGVDWREVAARLLDTYLYQIFHESFFHADPHPGNLFVQPIEGPKTGEGHQPFRLTFVDFGMVGQINALTSESLRALLFSVAQRDARGLTKAYDDLGFFLPGSDLERIARAQEVMLDHLWGQSILEMSQPDPREIHRIGMEFRDILYEFPFQIPKDFIFLGRALGMLSGLASQLDPEINPWSHIERFGREMLQEQKVLRQSLNWLLDYLRLLFDLPNRAGRFLDLAESGRLKVIASPDPVTEHRLRTIEGRLVALNPVVIGAAFLVSAAILYTAGETTMATLSASAAVILFVAPLLRRR